jgi:hypothetical protein
MLINEFFCRIKRKCRTMLHGFMPNHPGTQNHVQEDKKNRRQTELDGVGGGI